MEDYSKYSKSELLEIVNQLSQEKKIAESAINNQLDTFFVFNATSGQAIQWNDSFRKISGYSDEEISKLKAPESYYSKEDVLKSKDFLAQLKDKKHGAIELELICKNGQKVLTEYTVSLISDLIENEMYVISIGRDVTKRHEIENALRENELFLKAIMDNLPIGIAVNSVDPTVDFNYINDNFVKLYRTTKEKLMQPDSFWEAVYEDPVFRKKMRKRVLEDVLSGDPKRFYWEDIRIDRKNKPTTYITAMNIPVPENKLMISTVWDVTAKKVTELELKSQNEEYLALNGEYILQNKELLEAKKISEQNISYFQKLVERLPLPISISDGFNTLEYFNKKFTQVLGYTVSDVPTMEKWWLTAYPDKDYREKVKREWEQAILKAYETNTEISPQEWIVRAKTGEKRTCEFHMVPIGEKAIVVVNDITDERLKQYELIEARRKAEESDKLKSTFLANMSHEIRTPMNGILGFAELLKTSELSISKRELYLDVIEKSGKRMLSTINDLMDISKIESGQAELFFTKTDINVLCDSLLDFFTVDIEQKNLQLILQKGMPSSELVILSDREKLFAVLSNLIKNAIKFTSKGKIEFGYKIKESKKIEFFVKDTGIGIAVENQKKIFERFVQADHTIANKYEGAGLGLPITKAFVELMGGSIWLHSEENIGSEFYFTIPYKTSQNQEENEEIGIDNKKLAAKILKNLSVLIVEDEEFSRVYLHEMLNEKCREVESVTNGVEAVEFVRANKGVDLILMDIKMPEMNGYEATRLIRRFNKNVIIIAQTAFVFANDRKEAHRSGCDDYLSKPINENELNDLIVKHFENS